MIYTSIQLHDLIEDIGREETKKILADFSCPLNSDIEHFIHDKAIEFELVRLSRTTLIYAQEKKTDTPILVAFYSLSPKELTLEENITNKLKRKLFGTSYSLGNSIKSLLIGQLSKNYTNGANELISGDELMSLVFKKIKDIDRILTTMVVQIDCEDKKVIKEFYERFGFKLFRKDRNLCCYVIPTKKVIESKLFTKK